MRALDRAESFFWFLDRCSSMNFAVVAEGRGPLEEARLVAALERAREIHPALGVAIEAGAGGTLAFVPRPDARIALEREAGDDEWPRRLVALMVEPFELGAAPLARARWFDLPGDRWAIALVFHHAIADGRSGFRLAIDAIDEARGGTAQTRAPDTPRSLMASFPEAFAGSVGEADARDWKDELRRGVVRPTAIPGFKSRTGAPRPDVVVVHLSEGATTRLVERARAEGASVHGAIGAAELIAMRNRFPPGEAPALMLTSPVDLRSSLDAPIDAATLGLYVTLLSSTPAVDSAQDFWPLARLLGADLRSQLANGHGHHFYHLVPPTETLAPTPEAIAGFLAYMQRVPQACLLSNVGRMEALPEVHGVAIDRVSFALCPMAHQPVFVAASTWGGRLTLNVVHDANQFPQADCREAAATMRALLEG